MFVAIRDNLIYMVNFQIERILLTSLWFTGKMRPQERRKLLDRLILLSTGFKESIHKNTYIVSIIIKLCKMQNIVRKFYC